MTTDAFFVSEIMEELHEALGEGLLLLLSGRKRARGLGDVDALPG